MFTVVLYVGSTVFLVISFVKDKDKTLLGIRKAVKSFLNILPDFATIMAIVALLLVFFTPDMISRALGEQAGTGGMVLASVVGSITLIPGFVAFPLAASLLEQGAGIATLAVFISTLMMVGVVTFPLEKKYFGLKEAIWRNSLAYVWSFIAAMAIWGVMSL